MYVLENFLRGFSYYKGELKDVQDFEEAGAFSWYFHYDIEAPRVAKKAQAGQFIVLRVDEDGERIPLTIADFDREAGTITLIFR